MTDSQEESTLQSWTRRAAWLIVPLTILIGDFEIRWIREFGNALFEFPGYVLSSIMVSLTGWLAFTTLVRGHRARFVLIPLVATFWALLAIVSWGSMLERYITLTPHEFIYLLEEPQNGASLVADGWTSGISLVFVGLIVLWSFALLHSATEPTTRRARGIAATSLAACVGYVVMLPPVFEMPWMPYPTDVRSAYVLYQGSYDFVTGSRSVHVGTAVRDTVAPQDPGQRPSVLLIIGESMRLDRMSAFAQLEHDTTPSIAAFLEAHPDEAFSFDRHVPSSAATFWALTALLTGRYHNRDRDYVRKAPAIWQYADATGYRTFVASSQSWSWGKLRDYWLQPGPDRFADADTFGLPVVNDTGGDDVPAVEHINAWLDEDASTTPFLGVVQLNSTHYPFIASPNASWSTDDPEGLFDAATLRSDEAIGLLLKALKRRGELEDTVIIFTSDHAETYGDGLSATDRADIERRDPTLLHGARVASCEPVFVNAPMIVYVPQKWQARLNVDPATLRANTQRVTSHVDIFATLLAVLGTKQQGDIDGSPLFEPLSEDRIAYCFTSPGWALNAISGLGARQRDHYVYLRSNLTRRYYFDMSETATIHRRHLPTEEPAWARELLGQVQANERVAPILRHAARGRD